jgi:deoxyribonuclease-4
MPYLANLASPKGNIYDKSVKTLREECDRCNELGIPYLVTHLGSHRGQGKRAGLDRLIDAINTALDNSISETTILLENAAGTMNSIGSSFSDIQKIIDKVGKSHLGICFDTCHAFAAGYDLTDIKSVNNTVENIKDSVKLESLMLMHANDSKGKLASRIDRHEHIGMGQIGIEGFKAILHTEVFRKLPIILETPIDKFGADIMNLNRIRQLA